MSEQPPSLAGADIWAEAAAIARQWPYSVHTIYHLLCMLGRARLLDVLQRSQGLWSISELLFVAEEWRKADFDAGLSRLAALEAGDGD